jgi:hypothetical protein
MKVLMLAIVLAASIPLAPQPAQADCLSEAVESCKEEFGGYSLEVIAARGWCYIIRSGWCKLVDEELV